jgi:outer membrane biosynthesis protein TonB
MSRLRVRIELNRRMAGVPLDKMASVVEETRKFFYLLSEDVHIEADRGEWLASDFDAESLNFTAEYGSPVSAEQAQAFGAAFSGATSLRRVTIAQFTRIADFLGEDELVGFGLYQSDQETEPTEWRCLSKRDAMRFGEEIKLLAVAAGEQVQETQLPAVMNGSVSGRRLFKDRRERDILAHDPSKLVPKLVREMESSLSTRIGLLEGEVAEQSKRMQQIGGGPDAAEERFQKLLSAMETFWAQAPRQVPQLPAPTDVPARAEAPPPADAPVVAEPLAAPPQPRGWSVVGVTVAAALAIVAGLAFPEMQQQWARFATLEVLPMVKPKPPAAPALPQISTSQNPTLVRAVAARTEEPFVGPSIPLEIPATVKSKIQSEVRVDVVVAIDQEGNVTGARVTSTKGERAHLLVTEALRAARQSRFRPALEGEKTVPSQMVLSFLFKPESNEF